MNTVIKLYFFEIFIINYEKKVTYDLESIFNERMQNDY